MTNTVKTEMTRAWKRFSTFAFLDQYLRAHVGDTFTVRDLRAICPDICPNTAATWLSDYARAFGVKVSVGDTYIPLDKPIKIDSWGGRAVYIEGYNAHLYHVDALDSTWENYHEDTSNITDIHDSPLFKSLFGE